MRLAILMPLALTALLAFPQARADDDADEHPQKPDVAAELWEAHAKTFDLDGDGRAVALPLRPGEEGLEGAAQGAVMTGSPWSPPLVAATTSRPMTSPETMRAYPRCVPRMPRRRVCESSRS